MQGQSRDRHLRRCPRLQDPRSTPFALSWLDSGEKKIRVKHYGIVRIRTCGATAGSVMISGCSCAGWELVSSTTVSPSAAMSTTAVLGRRPGCALITVFVWRGGGAPVDFADVAGLITASRTTWSTLRSDELDSADAGRWAVFLMLLVLLVLRVVACSSLLTGWTCATEVRAGTTDPRGSCTGAEGASTVRTALDAPHPMPVQRLVSVHAANTAHAATAHKQSLATGNGSLVGKRAEQCGGGSGAGMQQSPGAYWQLFL